MRKQIKLAYADQLATILQALIECKRRANGMRLGEGENVTELNAQKQDTTASTNSELMSYLLESARLRDLVRKLKINELEEELKNHGFSEVLNTIHSFVDSIHYELRDTIYNNEQYGDDYE